MPEHDTIFVNRRRFILHLVASVRQHRVSQGANPTNAELETAATDPCLGKQKRPVVASRQHLNQRRAGVFAPATPFTK